jgi:N6-L-threonylcarbamoyladenine synthase
MELLFQKAEIKPESVDLFAVTNKPGLPGSLMVGLCFTKALAAAYNKPIIGIDHVEGHIFSVFLEHKLPFPYLCLSASGGHTALYLVTDFGQFEYLGQTIDDSAGEAFDKVAKLLNMPYPGGPEIEKKALKVENKDFFKYPRPLEKSFDFSFSGLKTAVLYHLVENGWYNLNEKHATSQLSETAQSEVSSSLQCAVKDIFVTRIERALKKYPQISAVAFVGGVACNNYLREQLRTICDKKNKPFFAPSKLFCTDNAAMIAFVASYTFKKEASHDYLIDIFE